MKKNYKTFFLSAYDKNGKPNIKALDYKKKQSGVYFIKNTLDKIVYVGYSENNLYKTIYRHFQQWTDKTKQQPRFVYDKKYKVRIIFTTPQRAAMLEKYLIKKMQPEDNSFKYQNYFLTEKEIEKSVEVIESAINFSNLEEPPF